MQADGKRGEVEKEKAVTRGCLHLDEPLTNFTAGGCRLAKCGWWG